MPVSLTTAAGATGVRLPQQLLPPLDRWQQRPDHEYCAHHHSYDSQCQRRIGVRCRPETQHTGQHASSRHHKAKLIIPSEHINFSCVRTRCAAVSVRCSHAAVNGKTRTSAPYWTGILWIPSIRGGISGLDYTVFQPGQEQAQHCSHPWQTGGRGRASLQPPHLPTTFRLPSVETGRRRPVIQAPGYAGECGDVRDRQCASRATDDGGTLTW